MDKRLQTLRDELTRRMEAFDPPLTPITLALRASLNRDAVRSIFREDKSSAPGLFKIDTLADCLGCSIDELLGRKDRRMYLVFKGNTAEESPRRHATQQIESPGADGVGGDGGMTHDEAILLGRFQRLTRERQIVLMKEAGNLVAEQAEQESHELDEKIVKLHPPKS